MRAASGGQVRGKGPRRKRAGRQGGASAKGGNGRADHGRRGALNTDGDGRSFQWYYGLPVPVLGFAAKKRETWTGSAGRAKHWGRPLKDRGTLY